MNAHHECAVCGIPLSSGISEFSVKQYKHALCMTHQRMIENSKATTQAKALYFALKLKKIPVVLEYNDSHKTIDIAIPGKLYIEVDGNAHQNPDQELTDLLRDLHSWKESIPTFRVSNSIIENPYRFNLIVDHITEICMGYKKAG